MIFFSFVFLLYVIIQLWIIIKVYLSPLNNKNYATQVQCNFSIIIVSHNEEHNLQVLLKNISQQKNVKEFEVVIVDDHSTDNTTEVVTDFQQQLNINLIPLSSHIFCEKNFKKQGQLIGVNSAKYETLLFLDSDCYLESNYFLSERVFHFNSRSLDFNYAPVHIPLKTKFIQLIDYIEWNALQAVTKVSALANSHFLCNAANMMVKKSIYEKNITKEVVKSTTASGDDIFLLQACLNNKHRIAYQNQEQATVYTYPNTSWKSYLFQRARWISKFSIKSSGVNSLYAIILFLANIFVLISLYYGILYFGLFFLVIFFIKIIIDYTLAYTYRKQYIPIFFFILASILYPLIMLMIVCIAFLKIFTWKNRKIVS